ncbi:Cof-type HAD-IIB family hydrolase [Orbaceae bacterium ac157xtp]
MYCVVASDLDGTLLTPDHHLSKYTKSVLQAIREKGIHFIFATGRHHIDVAQMRENMEIDAFMITSNGARIHDSYGQQIYSKTLEPSIVYQLAQIAKDDPLVYTHLYRGDDWLINKEDEFSLQFFTDTKFGYQLFDPTGNFVANDVSKFYFTTTDDSLYQHLGKLKQNIDHTFGDQITSTFSTLNCLEVMAKNVSKGSALKFLVERLGYTLQQSIAFGDGMNDYEMLSMAGKGCIMQNAQTELKALLPSNEVIGSNADDAVSHYLSHIFLNSAI